MDDTEPKRYDCLASYRRMSEADDGEYVLHSDYVALRAELSAARKLLERTRKFVDPQDYLLSNAIKNHLAPGERKVGSNG